MWAFALSTALLLGGALKFGFGPVADYLVGTAVTLIVAAVTTLAVGLAAKALRPIAALFSLLGVMLLSGAIGVTVAVFPMVLLLLPLVFVPLLLAGITIGAASRGGFAAASRLKKAVIVASGALVVSSVGYLIYGALGRGNDDHLVEYRPDPVRVAALDADDPSQPGPYSVATLTYGSGTDRRRPEFGEAADLVTVPVDASKLVKGSEGWRMKLRHGFWGFDFSSFPVNGRVWYPQGDGPFPLVLCVHGNHTMEEFSDPGYAYLGELLASRGFIFVSVDENFFNGSWRGDLKSENDGRGWMLLQHLKVWREWNRTAGHRFENRVALDRIALIGHSRGGEAAAIAGAFNRLDHYPDDATLEFDFDFGIRAIIAIAPSDGQYSPADRPTPLNDVSYLVIQGAHDQDVAIFMGARQYRRAVIGDDGYRFKASVYSYRSNHGQFNTVWGDTDWAYPPSLVLNLRPLLDGRAQRLIGSLYISAFLEATLRDRMEYVDLFRDHRSARRWLPEDYYVTRFQDTSFRLLADFDDDVDVTTGNADGVRLCGTNLAVWREEHQSFRKYGSKNNGVAVLGWRSPEASEGTGETPPGRYWIDLSPEAVARLRVTGDSLLVFSITDTGEKPPEDIGSGDDDGAADQDDRDDGNDGEGERKEPLDLSIELTTSDGIRSSLVLGTIRRIPVPLESRFTKLPGENLIFGPAWEPTLQTFEVPMSAFIEARPGFDPAAVARIGFVFDRSPEGVIFLDDIGFADPSTR